MKYIVNFSFLLALVFSNNNAPIVLVHGFMGWGRDEIDGYYYWGGENDYELMLRKLDYNVFTASVGPISSNWDRAIELFAQIKGGCVDYGLNHSKKFNLVRKPPKCYDGYYPEWDSNNPIHLIGHSQGGLTSRMLEYLLISKFPDESSSLLSQSHVGWINSITTISTPHNGTSLSHSITSLLPFAKKLTYFSGIFYNQFPPHFGFDLDQWGIKDDENINYYAFFNEIISSDIINSRNFSAWDLSIEGAEALNQLILSEPSTYYFSIATYTTKINSMGYHVPMHNTSGSLWLTSFMIGKNSIYSELYLQNDGLVNTVSMSAPKFVYQLYGKPLKGEWMLLDLFNYDHHQIVGRGNVDSSATRNIFEIYKSHCKRLYEL